MTSLLTLMALVLGAEPARYELQGNELKLPGPITFETNSDKLKPESDAVLEHVKGYLEAKTYITLLRVETHTDSMGMDSANQALSEERAAAVVQALIKKGVECSRLLAVGFGGNKPISANDTREGRALNRRTVFANAALKGRPIGGMPVDGGGKAVPQKCAK
ncbi:MAG: OmpA family protein [Archangium sp.]|nr:OmpA family protein [Archangium sp.]MDP3572606.1 OmpA family protein [Archangium sp.]